MTEFPPFSTVSGSFGDLKYFDDYASMIVTCPVCGYDYTHIDGFEEELGWESRQARELGGDSPYRGDGLRVSFHCEDGHHFDVVIQFHKGNTFVWCDTMEEEEEEL